MTLTKYHIRGILYVALYVAITLAPLFVATVGMSSTGRGFWFEFSIGLGFVGLTMICLQFILTARFKRIAAPYGIDIMLEFHRYISMVAAALIFAHPVLLFILQPELLSLLNLFSAPLRAQMGVMSLVSIILLIVLSVFRQQIGLRYEVWKTLHGILAILAVVGAFMHVLGVGFYLSLSWKWVFWGLILGITLLSLFYIRVIRPYLLKKRPYKLEDIREENGNSWTLTFRPVGHSGLRFKPGQFAWLTIGNSPYTIEEHPFSFSSSAENTETVSMTVKELGDFTSALKVLKPGETAYLDGPYGAFTYERNRASTGFVFVTGGVGITPVMSMLRTLADKGDKRKILLFYANKAWESATFRDEIIGLEKRIDMKVVHVLEELPEGMEHEQGFIDAEILKKHLPQDATGYAFFVCGPPPLMEAVEKALLDIGVPFDNIEMEYFNLV